MCKAEKRYCSACNKEITESDWYDFEGMCIECYAESMTIKYNLKYEESVSGNLDTSKSNNLSR